MSSQRCKGGKRSSETQVTIDSSRAAKLPSTLAAYLARCSLPALPASAAQIKYLETCVRDSSLESKYSISERAQLGRDAAAIKRPIEDCLDRMRGNYFVVSLLVSCVTMNVQLYVNRLMMFPKHYRYLMIILANHASMRDLSVAVMQCNKY